MVARIRLQRFGRKDLAFFRIVVADNRAPRDGRFIERLGHYNPHASKDGVKEVALNEDRVRYWLSVGARPTDRVGWLLGKTDMLPRPPVRNVLVSAKPKKDRKPSA